MRNVEEFAQMFIDNLCEKRRSFDDWWSSLEDDDQEEVLQEFVDVYGEWIMNGEIIDEDYTEELY